MNRSEFLILIEKIHAGTASEDEVRYFECWYAQFEKPADIWETMGEQPSRFRDELFSRVNAQIQEPIKPASSYHSLRRWYAVAAACLLFLFSGLFYVWFSSRMQGDHALTNADSLGQTGLLLSLSNGDEVDLLDRDNARRMEVEGITLSKTSEGQYICTVAGSKATPAENATPRTLRTSHGQICQVVLADGTRVWLNALSSLQFPQHFEQDERRVFLEGEAYFEVAKNTAQPFWVESATQELKVTGTHFNVEAYTDARLDVKTTLLEGGVSVRKKGGGEIVKLSPGMQLVVAANGKMHMKNVNTTETMGWRQGVFIFNNEKLETITLELNRWYDVEFVVGSSSNVLQQVFSGTVTRFDRVEEVLDVLAQTGAIHYKKEGRRVILMD